MILFPELFLTSWFQNPDLQTLQHIVFVHQGFFSHLFPSRISAKLLYNSASNSDSFFSGICRPSPLVTTFPCALHMSFWSLQLSLPIVALVFHDSKMPLSLTHLSSRQRSTAPHQLLQTMLVFTSFWIHPRFVDASVVLLELPWACGSANLSVVLIPWNPFEDILFNSIHQSRSKLADLLKKWFYKTWEKNFVNYHRLFSEKDPQNLNTPKTFIFSLLWVHQLELAVAGFSSVVPPPSSSAFVTPLALKKNVNKTRAKRPCTNLHCFET